MEYEFTMPFPPSVNGYWRAFRGRQIISKRGRDYRRAAMQHLDSLGLSAEIVKGDLAVTLTLNPPTLRRYDIDNFNKGLFDAMSAASFWEDDSQVTRLTIIKGEKVKNGSVLVKVVVI